MEISQNTKINISLWLIATIIASIVTFTTYFINLKNDLENEDKNIYTKIDNNFNMCKYEINQKADKVDVRELNVKMENMEKILIEIKEDVKDLKKM